MKKFIPLTALAFILTACGNPSTSSSHSISSGSSLNSETSIISEYSSSSVEMYYTITFDVNGKTTTSEVLEGEKVSQPEDPEVNGYEFIGWYTENICTNLYDFEKPVYSSFTLYAGFEEIPPVEYTVTFHPGEGKFDGQTVVKVVEGSLVNKPTDPELVGYKFIGWYTDSNFNNLYDFTKPVTSSFDLYAKYDLIEIETKYNIIASSEESLLRTAAFAADGNDDTYWKAKDKSKQIIEVDFNEVVSITKISQKFLDLNAWNFTIEGAFEKDNYVTLYEENGTNNGTAYETTVFGYYRYVRMTINESEIVATSKEFDITYSTLEDGTNIAYGVKGVADCWAGGFETELMFDGNEGNYHCCSSPHENHYMGFEMNSPYYIENLEVLFPDATDHKFTVDYKALDGSWPLAVGGDYSQNTESKDRFTIDLKDELYAVLLHHNGNSTGNWPAIKEFKAFGFKNYTQSINKQIVDDNEILDLGSLGYISRVKFNNKEALERKIEISSDAKNWNAVSLDNIDGNYIVINQTGRYIRYSQSSAVKEVGNVEVYALKYEHNLAMKTPLTATTRSGDSGYWENMATFNEDCLNAKDRYYCSSGYALTEELNMDLGRKCKASQIIYRWQDPASETNMFSLKVEVSLDGSEYTTLVDINDFSEGRDVVITPEQGMINIRYVKITALHQNGYTNCNKLIINGIGSPIR